VKHTTHTTSPSSRVLLIVILVPVHVPVPVQCVLFNTTRKLRTPNAPSWKLQGASTGAAIASRGRRRGRHSAWSLLLTLLLTQQAALTGRCDRAPVPVLLLFNTTPQSTGAATGKNTPGSRTHETDTRTSRTRPQNTDSNAPVTTPEPRDARVHKPPQARWW
jgi:hypothetical protein